MRSRIRTAIVLLLAAGLVALFLHNVDLWRVAADIVRARPEWLPLSLARMFANLAIRSLRWQQLLEPLGPTTFGGAFREIGRASCRERVEISVVAVSLKKKRHTRQASWHNIRRYTTPLSRTTPPTYCY